MMYGCGGNYLSRSGNPDEREGHEEEREGHEFRSCRKAVPNRSRFSAWGGSLFELRQITQPFPGLLPTLPTLQPVQREMPYWSPVPATVVGCLPR